MAKMAATIVIKDDPQWSISEIALKNPPIGWESPFAKAQDDIKRIEGVLKGKEYFPLKENIFRAFRLTPLNKVSVVIVGQDPYHTTDFNGTPTATGLSFSVNRSSAIPPSLNNIFTELSREFKDFKMPNHGDLSGWALQGVLMLNTCLTVEPHKAGSHGQIWLGLITRVIQAINETNPSAIYMLWGEKAQSIRRWISGGATILETSHPSPFSANRGFLGCNHFAMANEILRKGGKYPPIDWRIVTN